VAQHKSKRPRLVIGFAAETEHVIENARAKLDRKGCDWIVANDVSPATGIMGGERNSVHLITRDGVESWPNEAKQNVADMLVARIAATLAATAK
jgi:phosphopantothenoylcysteine decarboxylase / phosphopantothenate---cysteine ligase